MISTATIFPRVVGLLANEVHQVTGHAGGAGTIFSGADVGGELNSNLTAKSDGRDMSPDSRRLESEPSDLLRLNYFAGGGVEGHAGLIASLPHVFLWSKRKVDARECQCHDSAKRRHESRYQARPASKCF